MGKSALGVVAFVLTGIITVVLLKFFGIWFALATPLLLLVFLILFTKRNQPRN